MDSKIAKVKPSPNYPKENFRVEIIKDVAKKLHPQFHI